MGDIRTRLAPEITELGLEEYVLELEVDGLTVVPPEVHGVTDERIDELAQLLLERAEELAGRLPGARLVVLEGAGHPCYLEEPERFHAELLEFFRLARLTKPNATKRAKPQKGIDQRRNEGVKDD